MKKPKFDPRSLLGKSIIDAGGDAFVLQTHSIRVVRENGKDIELDEEDLATKDPKCYDVEVTNGKITFVFIREYNEHKV